MGAENSPTDQPVQKSAESYRLVVLGGGPAGIAAAREAARRGVRVALVLPAADQQAPETPLIAHIRQVQARAGQLPPSDPPDEPGIDVSRGRALFCRPDTVAVDGRELRFRKALIATGTVPAPVAIEGADQSGCLTVETLTQLTERPRRLAVIGSGPVACQWAQAFGRFGSQVHLIARHPTILPEQDPDAAGLVRNQMEQEGLRLHLGCDELSIETTGNLRGVVIGRSGRKEKLLVEQILLCGPRRPNVDGLGLATAAVAYSDHGIVVDDRLRTTDRQIFAAGEVCGPEFASLQAAEATAQLAVHNALGIIRRRLGRLVIPRCIYTHPAVAHVGLTRGEAAERRIEIDTYREELVDADKSCRPEGPRGFLAVYVRRRTGRLVGATVVAGDADELIAPLVLLLTRRWPLTALADVLCCRPSRFEFLTRLARRCAETRRTRRWAGWVEPWRAWFGR